MAWESVNVEAKHLVSTVNRLIEEGNVRRIRLIHDGHILFEIPLTYGVGIGALAVTVAPVLAAVGAVAAIITHCTVEIERPDPPTGPTDVPPISDAR